MPKRNRERRFRVPVYQPWADLTLDDEDPFVVVFDGSLRSRSQPGPPLSADARCSGSTCPCEWCR